jgi:hypothetical protein
MGLPRGQSKVALSILVHSNAFVSGLTCDSVSSRFMGVREMPPPLIFLILGFFVRVVVFDSIVFALRTPTISSLLYNDPCPCDCWNNLL